MMHHSTKGMAIKLIILGIILILVRLYTSWDIWVVFGVLLIIKAIIIFIKPDSYCKEKAQAQKKK